MTIMKIWHTTVGAAVFTALLVCGMAWPYDESESVSLEDVDYPAESQENMMEDQYYIDHAEPGDEFKETYIDHDHKEKKLSGFRHVYHLDMTHPDEKCPDALKLHTSNSLRLCGKKTGNSCNSITIPTHGQQYQEVRGVVKAYQFGSPDAFEMKKRGNINSKYVDGVSITYGKSPRKHIWTYAIGYRQYKSGKVSRCTCPSTGGRPQPAFVGDNYFCSSGNPGNSGQKHGSWGPVLYPTLLWCNIQGDCSDCGGNDLYFCKKLDKPTTDNLEVRVCTDENLKKNEDIRIEYMDFYIR